MMSLFSRSSFFKLSLIFSFVLAGALIPVIGMLFLFTLPQVFFVLSQFNSPGKVFLAFLLPLAAAFAFLFMMQSMMPALALMIMGLSGLAMYWSTRRNYPIDIIVFLPSLLILGAVVFYFMYGGMQLSISPWQLVEKHIQQAVDLNITLYSRLPISAEELKAIQESRTSVIQMFTRIFPALCIIGIFFTSWLSMLTSKLILLKSGLIPPQFVELKEWKAPAWMIWVFLAAGGAMLIPQERVTFIGVNAFLCVSFVYLLQGFAIVSFFFEKKEISSFLRGLFYFFIAIQQILVIAIALVGFFDIWVDFRKFLRNDQATA